MVNWMDPAVMLAQAAAFTKILIAVLGFYTWETLINLWYDWDIITKKRNFKWPMVVYWLCKYTMFFAGIGLNIASNDSGKLDCQSLYTFNQLMGNFAIGSASSLLMLRTIAIWNKKWVVIGPLLVLSAGQWAILLHGITTVRAVWTVLPNGAGQCVVTAAPQIFLQLLYIYTMSFDLIVLILTTIGLLNAPGRNRSGLYNLLIKDGLVFFIVAFTSNAIVVILVLLNLNPIMNIIAAVPAAAITCTVACRSFVRLSTYSHSTYVHSANSSRARAGSASRVTNKVFPTTKSGNGMLHATSAQKVDGVHVQMDTFVTGSRGVEESRISFGDVESRPGDIEKDGGLGNDSDDAVDRKHGRNGPRSFVP